MECDDDNALFYPDLPYTRRSYNLEILFVDLHLCLHDIAYAYLHVHVLVMKKQLAANEKDRRQG